MTIVPIIPISCGFVGCIAGAASGARDSVVLAFVGAALGIVLGFASFWVLVIPYVLLLIQYEKRRHPAPITEPPRLWKYLFFPVMISTLIVAVLVPWYVVGLLK